jgi:hypothetical protein
MGASWCNGAAGFVHLWTLAYRLLGDGNFARLAQMAGWSTYEGTSAAPGDLCCGLAGRAYALLGLYRQSGDTAWLARARELTNHASRNIRVEPLRRNSLYKGEVGVALLVADLEHPEHGCMPLYDAEGWAQPRP